MAIGFVTWIVHIMHVAVCVVFFLACSVHRPRKTVPVTCGFRMVGVQRYSNGGLTPHLVILRWANTNLGDLTPAGLTPHFSDLTLPLNQDFWSNVRSQPLSLS